MARYTVIGAGGFIGSRVVAALAADGCEVEAPGRGADLTTRDLGRVIYCAGLTGDYRTRPFDTVEAHAALVSRILQAGRYERLVYLSSTRLYQTTGAAIGREDAPLNLDPGDREQVYELSMALGENLAVNRSDGRGCAARLSYVFDWTEGAEGFLAGWFAQARAGREITIASTPEDGRDFIHVSDVIRALRAMADQPVNEIVNVASGRTTTNAEIAEVFEAAGWRVRFTGDAPAAAPTRADIGRLRALGLEPRPALEVIAGYLKSL